MFLLDFCHSNCTGRGRGWQCCVPNYLRMFPKIATETSHHVRLVLLSWNIYQDAPLFLPFQTLTHTFFPFLSLNLSSLSLSVVFLLYAQSDHLLLSFVSLCRWCHAGHSEKHRWLHQCKLHQCELAPLLYFSFIFWSMSLCLVWGVLGGLFY